MVTAEQMRGLTVESAHAEIGKLLASLMHTGKTDTGPPNDSARARLIEYTAGARAFLVRAEERGVAALEARAVKVEAKAKGGADSQALLMAMGEIDMAVDGRVDARGMRVRDRTLAALQSAGNSVVMAEAVAAWTEMETFIRESSPRPMEAAP